MTIAILIFAYLCWLGDILEVIQCKASNILISSVLTTLLSWQVSTAWGIVMLVIGFILSFFGMAFAERD